MNEETAFAASIIPPLQIVVGNDEKKHIVDQETQDDYAVIEGDKLRMYNAPSDDDRDIQGIFYRLEDVNEVRLSEKMDSVQVKTVGGDVYTHEKFIGSQVINLDIPDYSDDSIDTLFAAVRCEFPSLKEDLYWDVLRDRPMINTRMVGDNPPQIVPYMGGSRSPELTKIRMILSRNSYETTSFKGSVKTKPYNPSSQDVDAVLYTLAYDNPRDPFIEWIRRIKWDGRPRVDTFLYLVGCSSSLVDPKENEEYLKIVWRGTLLSVLQRHLDDPKPIQFIPIIIGEQGVGKSTLCMRIGMKDWYRDTTKSFEDQKAFYESVQGACIVELKEGTQLEKGALSTIKAFSDAPTLQYRKSYGADAVTMRIFFTMMVTTNNETILRDDANRRFFPFHMYREDAYKTIEEFDDEYFSQMWAEALVMYREGKRWDSDIYEDEKGGLKPFILKAQGAATQLAGWEIRLKEIIDKYHPHKGDEVTSTQIRFYLENGDPEYFDERVDMTGRTSRAYQPDLYKGKDLDSVMVKFGKGTSKFDLMRLHSGNVRDPKTGNRVWTVTYRRTKDAD